MAGTVVDERGGYVGIYHPHDSDCSSSIDVPAWQFGCGGICVVNVRDRSELGDVGLDHSALSMGQVAGVDGLFGGDGGGDELRVGSTAAS